MQLDFCDEAYVLQRCLVDRVVSPTAHCDVCHGTTMYAATGLPSVMEHAAKMISPCMLLQPSCA